MGLSSFNLPSSIHLDYGADTAPFACRDVHVSSRGVRLKSRSRFEAGTEIALDVVLGIDDTGRPAQQRRFRLAGVVVDCQLERVPVGSSAPPVYQITLLFWEKTEEIDALLQALEKVHRNPPPIASAPTGGLRSPTLLSPSSAPVRQRQQ